MNQPIKILYQPNEFEKKKHYFEKSGDDGVKHRYLAGIASGSKLDGHGERITRKGIESFHKQANEGNILLYADKHGVAFTDDIGILTKSVIQQNGDWYVEFRLYDEGDDIGPTTKERIDKLWKQMNGLPPYKHPMQKGFSVEGYIPENGILEMDENGQHRIIDDVTLDGAVVVPRPAYQTSIAHSFYKALGEQAPGHVKKAISDSLLSNIGPEAQGFSYYKKRYLIDDALQEKLEAIMSDKEIKDKKGNLKLVFDQYRDVMIDLLMNTEEPFMESHGPQSGSDDEVVKLYKNDNKLVVLKGLYSNLEQLQKALEDSK